MLPSAMAASDRYRVRSPDSCVPFNFLPEVPPCQVYIIYVKPLFETTPLMPAKEFEHPSGCTAVTGVVLSQAPCPAVEEMPNARPAAIEGRRSA
jgi:hypothetical protein